MTGNNDGDIDGGGVPLPQPMMNSIEFRCLLIIYNQKSQAAIKLFQLVSGM